MKDISVLPEEKILIVAPHPDDECIGAGGLIFGYSKQCDVWLLSDGRLGIPQLTEEETVAIRRNEFEIVMRKIGVNNYRFFHLHDGELSHYTHYLDNESLKKYKKIFVSSSTDSHRDHRAAFHMIWNAINHQGLFHIEVYQYEVTMPLRNVTHIYDITKFAEEKYNLISLYKSQMAIVNYIGIAKGINEFRGGFLAKKKYAEAYSLTNGYEIPIYADSLMNECHHYLQIQNDTIMILDSWLRTFLEHKEVVDYLKRKQIKYVSFYGFGRRGKQLYDYLLENNITVSYIIDNYIQDREMISKYNIINSSLISSNMGLIIITPIEGAIEISNQLYSIGYYNHITFKDLIKKACES